PSLFGATIIVSIVLSLPTVGPIYLESLLNQDMFLAGSIVLMIAVVTILGTLISDILLAIADPRIRLE
ncbi:MAG TPA: ABC transporter permease subunit, partial [Actinobacteria bacterium]|nr:ABC transporter permease subunit [Actinomycetota bacterium]